MFACTEKVYRLLIALQPEDANALKWNSVDAARLVELQRVREGALQRTQGKDDDEGVVVAEAKAGDKRPPLPLDPCSEPAALRARGS